VAKKTVFQFCTLAAVVVKLLLPFPDHAYIPRQFSLFHNSTRRRGTRFPRDYSVMNFLDIRIELHFNQRETSAVALSETATFSEFKNNGTLMNVRIKMS